MPGKGTFPMKVESNARGFAIALKSAACEWLLLFLLLLDAAFSYFLTKFAQYCELELPCILCSRLEHVLGSEKPDFYKNLLCNEHKSHISSLVLCHNHGMLADVHEMCEDCLLSFGKEDSCQDVHKILMGKLGLDCLEKPFLNIDSLPGSVSTRLCSCCAKPWRCRPNVQKVVQSKVSGSVSKPDIPLPKSPGRRLLNRQEGGKKRKDRFSVSTTPLLLGCDDFDSLSHVGYTEVKINSDSDSDYFFSDDEEINAIPPTRRNIKGENLSQRGSKLLDKGFHDQLSNTKNKLRSLDDEPERGEMITPAPTRAVSNGDTRPIFGEIKWQQIRKKAGPALPDFLLLDDIPLSSSAPEISPIESIGQNDMVPHLKAFSASGLSDHPVNPNMQCPGGHLTQKWKDTEQNGNSKQVPAMNNWESIDLISNTREMGLGKDPQMKHPVSLPQSSSFEAGDIASTSKKDSQTPETVSGQVDRRDLNGNGLNEKTTAPEVLSSSQTVPLSSGEKSTMNGHAGGSQTTPISVDTSVASKVSSIEKSLSFESLEGSFCEVVGGTVVDKLETQIELDKIRISELCKELDEERSAAAIAANQAMAMITKLQEEKAALHMEALQYLRMMEEQAEYDVDALEKAEDTLAEKEKQIQDLEAELDYFRIKYPEDFPEDPYLQGGFSDLEDTDVTNLESIDFES